MRRLTASLWVITLFVLPATGFAKPKTIEFKSKDGLQVTADLYLAHADTAPFIVLFHQARWSRGEYMEIAPKLNELGFNCLAVDQRSGDAVNEVTNETAKRAKAKGLPTRYVDAVGDMLAAIDHAKKRYAKGKLIIWGSSYSSALSLRLAGEHPDLGDGVLAFAPGEYFAKQGKSDTWIREGASKIDVPVFITSARGEKESWAAIYTAIPSKSKRSYLPKTKGNHGSRALWAKFDDSAAYWDAVKAFLRTLLD